jgi:hypothetical protein
MYRLRRELLYAGFACFLTRGATGQSTRNIWDRTGIDTGLEQEIPQRSRSDRSAATLKFDYEQNLKDLDHLTILVKNLRDGLQTSGPAMVPAPLLRDSEEVRKLSKRVFERLRASR